MSSETIIEKVNFKQSENHAEQYYLSMLITAAHIDDISKHNTFKKKRKLNWDTSSHIDAVNDDEDEHHFILLQMKLILWDKSFNCDS